MIVSRILAIPSWDDSAAQVSLDYWGRRGFRDLILHPGPRLVGHRGSEVGSWFPVRWFTKSGLPFELDWGKCRASIDMRPDPGGGVSVELEGFLPLLPGRRYRGWCEAFWRLEVAELHHLLRGTEPLRDVWARFEADSRDATQTMMWTKGLIKRPVSEDWIVKIEALELSFLASGDERNHDT